MKNVNLAQPVADLDGNAIIFGEKEVTLENGQRSTQPYGRTYAQIAIEGIASLKLKAEEDNQFAYALLKKLHVADADTEYSDDELQFVKQAVFAAQPVIVRAQYDELIA
ncbi:MAG: hypothetical protein P4L28_11995 [Paludibacteraceae bacterium]|nr:hypothetical protein [Paludibacteraceae bacterium]